MNRQRFINSAFLAASVLVVLQAGGALAAKKSACPEKCFEHGVCNEELGRCDCPRHLTGPTCEQSAGSIRKVCQLYGYAGSTCTQETPGQCLNNCNERGVCLSGWCHCQKGYYGADCSISLDASGKPEQLAGLGFKQSTRKPLIYIYEVPPLFNTWRNIEKYDRPLYTQLWKRIISSGHRTLNPEEADYYYIPTDFRYLRQDSLAVLKYVWTTWPYWNQTDGARHLLVSTSDLGGCEGVDLMNVRNVTEKATWITAWGLTRKHPRVWWPGCHRPGLDIVIPIPALTPGMVTTPLNVAVGTKTPRNITFFFAGKVCGDNLEPKPPGSAWPICQTPTNPLYSAGMRQQVYAQHAHRDGYKIVTRSPTYLEDMSGSVFCLAPTGGGHGKRQVLVARFGCIPVPITDFVMQPYEPELPWQDFSVPIQEAQVPRMHEILAAITPDKIESMQKALHCASRHMWWTSMWGSIFGEDGRYDAFATLMEILAVRLRHPGVAPQELIKVDEHFAKFARCELGDDTAGIKALLSGNSMSPDLGKEMCFYGFDRELQHLAPTGFCPLGKWRKYGQPGGAVCWNSPNVAQCPRPYE